MREGGLKINKTINLRETVYEICKNNPQVMEIMKGLGFKDIMKPGMINTAGRFMTIPKGAKMKGIPIEKIKKTLIENGYKIKE